MTKNHMWKMVCSGLIGLLINLPGVVCSQEAGMTMYVTDALTFPGKPTRLQARLIDQGPDGEAGVPEQLLEFFVQDREVGQTTTDTEGWARLDFTPKMRGNFKILVKVVTAAKRDRVQGTGVLLSWERRRPILLIDLAVVVEGDLITDAPPPKLVPDPDLILGKPHPAATGELGKLSKFYYNLVYLDRTGKGRLEDIQAWLRAHAFPPGVIRLLPDTATALSNLLQDLKEEGWVKVSGGIGRTADFAQVLVQNRLQTVIVTSPDNREHFPRRAIVLHDWSRVRRHL